jgi:predicted  nucleic acid-binding Zn-ribbon protein
MFACQECGRKFRTTAAAESAANNGCPGCGGCDIDLAPVESAAKVADSGYTRMIRDFNASKRVED